MKIKEIIKTVFVGVGQIFLQENFLSGMLIFLGILFSSESLALGLIVGSLVGTLSAIVLKYDISKIKAGLYGFSPALVGVVLPFIFEPNIWVFLLIIPACFLTTLFTEFGMNRGWRLFTFPFILASWVFVPILTLLSFASHTSSAVSLVELNPMYEILNHLIENVGGHPSFTEDFLGAFHGYGQVIFQGTMLAGVLFFLAVYIETPIAAVYGIIASFIAVAFAHILRDPNGDIQAGIYSFNAVLCAIVFAGTKKMDGFWVFISVILSVIIHNLMNKYGIPAYTFPFVLATWITLLLVKITKPKLA